MRIVPSIIALALLVSCNQKDLNLMIIHTDQQSQWTVGVYGLDDLRGPLTTPNLDNLAKDGVLFTNFFTNSAVCSPSRALMMTGLYATGNGVYTNNNVMKDVPTLASILKEAGYSTGYSGKWHLSGTAKPGWAPESYGWDDNRFMFNRGHYKKITENEDGSLKAHPYKEIGDEESFTTDWLTDKTLDFIRENQDNKFAYMVSYPDPHQPWEVREPFNSMYPEDEMSVPESYSHHDDPINSWLDSLIQKHYKNVSPERIRRFKAMYSGSVHLIDYNVGRLVEELKSLDLYDKTLVVFTSDHGEYMGEHGMFYKNQFFEAAYQLPMVIHHPDIQKDEANDAVFSMVDFAPGILGLMGIENEKEFHGRDFSVAIDGQDQWDDVAHVHHANHTGVGVFTPEYYLIIHKSGENLLFDRVNDPMEMKNLYNDPRHQNVVELMTELVKEHHKMYGTPEYDWICRLVE